MLQGNDHGQNDETEEQILQRTIIGSFASSAEGLDADGDQGKTDGEYNRSGDNRREKFTERFQTEA